MLAFVEPGPRVTRHTPGFASELCTGFRHVRRSTFPPTDDRADPFTLAVQAIEDRKEALSRHAKDVVDAVYAQRVSNHLTACTCGKDTSRGIIGASRPVKLLE